MHINFDTEFEISLILILDFIALDKVSAAISFHKELYRTFDLLKAYLSHIGIELVEQE